ncbi:MAG TPA: histidine phosphatase family protein [Acidimicrobiales bacterium]|nr:histidine phosphatase family protein [Acidimicrobiales bacterium]
MTSEVRQLSFMRPPGATDVLLVRHGESVPAREDAPFELVGGHGDPELDPVGVGQAEKVCARLASRSSRTAVEAIYVTTLQRTAQTAAPLAKALGLEPMVEPDLREVFLGEWEGGLYRLKVMQGDPLSLRMLEEERWDVIPGAERDEDFAARVRAGINRIASKHPDQTVAVFTHGGVIGRAVAEASGARPFSFLAANNASITHLVVMGDRWVVRCFNDTAHLNVV